MVEEADMGGGAEYAKNNVGEGDGALERVLAVVEQLVPAHDRHHEAVFEQSTGSDEGVEKYLRDQLRFLAAMFVAFFSFYVICI